MKNSFFTNLVQKYCFFLTCAKVCAKCPEKKLQCPENILRINNAPNTFRIGCGVVAPLIYKINNLSLQVAIDAIQRFSALHYFV